MKIYQEIPLSQFDFAEHALMNAEQLTDYELNMVEPFIEEMYPDGIDRESLNDIFAYEFEWVCEKLDIKPWYENESK